MYACAYVRTYIRTYVNSVHTYVCSCTYVYNTVWWEIFTRFIFRVFGDLTECMKVYPANLLISQYEHIIAARKSRNYVIPRNVCSSVKS